MYHWYQSELCNGNWNIFLNKKESIAIKEDKIILKGVRNKYNGLWNIPVWKETVVENNQSIPNIHPSIYSAISEKRITKQEPNTWRIENQLRRIKVVNTKLPREFQVFDSLIEHTICGKLIAEQTSWTRINISKQYCIKKTSQ